MFCLLSCTWLLLSHCSMFRIWPAILSIWWTVSVVLVLFCRVFHSYFTNNSSSLNVSLFFFLDFNFKCIFEVENVYFGLLYANEIVRAVGRLKGIPIYPIKYCLRNPITITEDERQIQIGTVRLRQILTYFFFI